MPLRGPSRVPRSSKRGVMVPVPLGYAPDLITLIVTRAGTVRELVRPSSSKFKRLRLQFSSVQFLPSNLLWKVRSVQFIQVPLISKVQFVQFEVHSVQFSSTFSSGGQPLLTKSRLAYCKRSHERYGRFPGRGWVLDHCPPKCLKVSSESLKKAIELHGK